MKTLPLVLLAIAAGAHAQEVTVTEPVWLRHDKAPEHLPERRHHTLPSYPREARKSGEIGYALIQSHIAADGKTSSRQEVATQVILERAVQDDPWITEMKPALQDGKPVEADIWYAFLFNPESATTTGPESTPRLLAVTPLWVPGKMLAGLGERPVIRGRLSISADGRVTQAELESPADTRFLKAVTAGTAEWRFAPARHNGQPVAATITLPLILSAKPRKAFAEGKVQPPHVIKQVQPFYPWAMRWFRMQATVTMNFVVDIHGDVQNPVIKSSSNPGFEESALGALKKWKFSPGTVNGKPVPMATTVSIVFQMEHDNHDAYTLTTASQAGLPPEFRYDTPPVVRGAIQPAYPYADLRDGRTGNATVEILIDPVGKVVRTKVVEASAPEFAQVATAALETYQFDPALKAGKATQALLKEEFHFDLYMAAPDTDGEDMYTDRQLLRRLEDDPSQLAKAHTLDHPLRPISRRPPVFPANLIGQTNKGTAVIEIVIDKDGRARIPKIISATDPAFGYAAAQAALYWRFDPPKVGGKSVFVRVQVPFNFVAKKV